MSNQEVTLVRLYLVLQTLDYQLLGNSAPSHSTDLSFTESGTRPSIDTLSSLHLSTGSERRMAWKIVDLTWILSNQSLSNASPWPNLSQPTRLAILLRSNSMEWEFSPNRVFLITVFPMSAICSWKYVVLLHLSSMKVGNNIKNTI